jgi:putative addiction module component (TIGR02574 family)
MTAHAKSVTESALALPADDRAELAERLLLSLDEKHHSELDTAWIEIVERRIADMAEGRVLPIPGDEALRMIRQRQRARS